MFHAAPLFLGITPMMETGGSLVILPDFDAAEMIRAIERERCTFTIGVPAMYKMLLLQDDLLAESDCSSLHFVMCGSAEVPEELLRGFEETDGRAHAGGLRHDRMPCGAQQPTLGHPENRAPPVFPTRTSNSASSIPKNPANDIPTGEIGELLVRSPAVTKGYHNLPEVTAERLLAGGWLRDARSRAGRRPRLRQHHRSAGRHDQLRR